MYNSDYLHRQYLKTTNNQHVSSLMENILLNPLQHNPHLSTLKKKPFNPLPNDNFLDWSKFKAFADGKIIVTYQQKFLFGLVENIVGKGENAGYQHFLLFSQCFQKVSFESRDCMVKC